MWGVKIISWCRFVRLKQENMRFVAARNHTNEIKTIKLRYSSPLWTIAALEHKIVVYLTVSARKDSNFKILCFGEQDAQLTVLSADFPYFSQSLLENTFCFEVFSFFFVFEISWCWKRTFFMISCFQLQPVAKRSLSQSECYTQGRHCSRTFVIDFVTKHDTLLEDLKSP